MSPTSGPSQSGGARLWLTSRWFCGTHFTQHWSRCTKVKDIWEENELWPAGSGAGDDTMTMIMPPLAIR